MRKLVLSVLCGLAASLVIVAIAFAEEYVVNIVVDGKPIALAVVVDGDSLKIDSTSPGVVVSSISAVAAVAEPAQPIVGAATANRKANLRSGPGTNFPIAGSVQAGQTLALSGRNAAGDWYQLADGNWLAAFLVNNAPSELAVIGATVAQPLQPVAPTIVPAAATPVPAQTVAPTAAPVSNAACDPSYPGICIPANSPDLDCDEISDRRFQVVGADPHGFDRDRDGIGCES